MSYKLDYLSILIVFFLLNPLKVPTTMKLRFSGTNTPVVTNHDGVDTPAPTPLTTRSENGRKLWPECGAAMLRTPRFPSEPRHARSLRSPRCCSARGRFSGPFVLTSERAEAYIAPYDVPTALRRDGASPKILTIRGKKASDCDRGWTLRRPSGVPGVGATTVPGLFDK